MDVNKNALLVIAAIVIGVAVIGLLMPQIVNFILRRQSLTDEYCARFLLPLKERANVLGISDDDFIVMWKFATQASEPQIIGLAPGSIMRNLIDHWEADRDSCMAFIADESRALGYKYALPATQRTDSAGEG